MSNSPEERIDRRDFMIASMAAAGASAAHVVAAGTADAQTTATTSAVPASGTVYTGDTIQGKRVVSALDVDVDSTFDLVRQSLPAIPTLEAVLASHQVAIAQLAIEYCNAAVDTVAVRNALWGGSFTAWNTAPNAQAPGWELALADPQTVAREDVVERMDRRRAVVWLSRRCVASVRAGGLH